MSGFASAVRLRQLGGPSAAPWCVLRVLGWQPHTLLYLEGSTPAPLRPSLSPPNAGTRRPWLWAATTAQAAAPLRCPFPRCVSQAVSWSAPTPASMGCSCFASGLYRSVEPSGRAGARSSTNGLHHRTHSLHNSVPCISPCGHAQVVILVAVFVGAASALVALVTYWLMRERWAWLGWGGAARCRRRGAALH